VESASGFFWTKLLGGSKVQSVKSTLTNFYLFLAIACAMFFGATAASGQSDVTIPTIKFSNVPITTGIENFARMADLNFIIEPNLFTSSSSEPVVTLEWTNITAAAALSRLLKEHNLVMVRDAFTTVTLITTTNYVANIVDASLLTTANEVAQTKNELVPVFRFEMAPLDVALKKLIESGHINVVLDSKVSDYVDQTDPMKPIFHNVPSISLRWTSLTAKQAVVELCEIYNLVIVKDAVTGAVSIKPKG
jgi:hypothetical protein